MVAARRTAAEVPEEMPRVWQQVLAHARPDQDQLAGRKFCRLPVSGEWLQRCGHLGQGGEMKITLLGVLAIVGVAVLLAYIIQQAQQKPDQNKDGNSSA